MTIAESKRSWTDQELLAMPHDGIKREIIGGEIVMMSPANYNHGTLISRLYAALGPFVYDHHLGELADGQSGFRLNNGDLLCPDISFISAARDAAHRASNATFLQGAPDLAVEVLSPSDTIELLEEKLRLLFNSGTRLAWIVHPRTKCIHVYRTPDAPRVLHISDTLEGQDVIPGFSLPVSKLFT